VTLDEIVQTGISRIKRIDEVPRLFDEFIILQVRRVRAALTFEM
jgi:hypothetical protein